MAGETVIAQTAGHPTNRSARLMRAIACDYCKLKKIRCNRENSDSCANCLDRAQRCTVSVSCLKNRRAPKTRATLSRSLTTTNSQISGDSQASVTIVDDEPARFSLTPSVVRGSESASVLHEQLDDDTSVRRQLAESAQNSWRHPSRRGHSSSFHTEYVYNVALNTQLLDKADATSCAQNLSCRETSRLAQPKATNSWAAVDVCEEDSIPSGEFANWEYHGPRSCLSLCSQSGVQWVEAKVGSEGFHRSAQTFTADITKRLRLSRELSVDRVPDPDAQTAWKYTKAYFDHALDAAMGFVHRPTFEAQLREYLQEGSTKMDGAWHALRNAIYASGCRITLSESRTFDEANNTAWKYFENALALLTGTIMFRTSISSVQALTMMAYYSQNFGSPCLEYMLCNNALALAVSKGLHRQPAPAWNLPSNERSVRSCLFWALYCLEKQIIKQSGRPSIIDDEEMTCHTPEAPSPAGAFNMSYTNILIQLARFSSSVSKRLSSVKILQIGALGLARTVAELDEQLSVLRKKLEPEISLGGNVNPNRLPIGINLQQANYLHCFYYTTVLDIHNTLTYPWSRALLGLTPQTLLRAQAEKSFEVVLKTCHTAMLMLHYVHIDAATPVPLSFFTPFYVLTNLFICILQKPEHDHVSLALSLMDLGVGFFTRLHVATTSKTSMQFAKELASLAQGVISRARDRNLSGEYRTQELSEVLEDAIAPVSSHYIDHSDPRLPEETFTAIDAPQDLEFEQWSTLAPAGIDLDGIDFVFSEQYRNY